MDKGLFRILILFSFIFLNLMPLAYSSYSISTAWQEDMIIERIIGTNVINRQGDLISNVFMEFYISPNYTSKHSYIEIYFEPWEPIHSEPIKNISIKVCDYPSHLGWNWDGSFSLECNKSYDYNFSELITRERAHIHEGEIKLKNYKDYKINFTPKKIKGYQRFIFLINYTLPNFTFKQGDYYVAWLSLPNMDDEKIKIENSIVLPSKEDIPRFIPTAKKIDRISYEEKTKIFYRWAFIFEGSGDKIIWYLNDKEIKENEIKLQNKYTWKGILIGFLLSILGAIFLPSLSRILRKFFTWFF